VMLEKVAERLHVTPRYVLNLCYYCLVFTMWTAILNNGDEFPFWVFYILTCLIWFIPFYIMIRYEEDLEALEKIGRGEK